MELLPVHSVGLPKQSKCRLIFELSIIDVPVVVRSFTLKQEIVVSIARIPTSTVHLNKESYMKMDEARHDKIASLVERMLDLLTSLICPCVQ